MINTPPFSNGTMGSIWMSANCARCERDHGFHNGNNDTDQACPILLRIVVAEFPIEELTDTGTLTDEGWDSTKLICSQFRPCRPCAGEPIPAGPLPWEGASETLGAIGVDLDQLDPADPE